MQTIKSKKWYLNQIAVRENAVKALALGIDNPFSWSNNVPPDRLIQAQKTNAPIQAQCKSIYTEINDLKYKLSLYYS